MLRGDDSLRNALRSLVGEIVKWWHRIGARKYPWRETSDPWHVLVAEVLLIQTNAAKVVKVYEEFVKKYSTPAHLAEAEVSEVEELLRPLGLHKQRAKLLKRAAEVLCREYGCRVPETYEELRRLPGVGDYVASAVLLFAYGKTRPLVDVNVARVLCRLALGEDPPRRYSEDEVVARLAASIEWSREVALALIDFAATICTAKSPSCGICPARGGCSYARRRGTSK
jgi:A/G-specific adenine glycosylase